jgi:hypothetical protein
VNLDELQLMLFLIYVHTVEYLPTDVGELMRYVHIYIIYMKLHHVTCIAYNVYCGWKHFHNPIHIRQNILLDIILLAKVVKH